MDKFKDGIKCLMESTFFKFDNCFSKQTYGTPMGFPISGTLADIVMQDLDAEILKKLTFKIPVYYRYTDNTFLIITSDKILETN